MLELLEYLGTFSILIAVIVYFVEAPQRRKTKHYQAWQVINTAQGKGGSGGRIEAVEELNDDGEPLVGIDLSGSFLQDVKLEKANLRRADFSGADVRRAKLNGAMLQDASLHSTNLRDANLGGADVDGVDFENADLHGADLSDLHNWKSIRSIKSADIGEAKNPPGGFVEWAVGQGAVNNSEKSK